MIYRPISVWLSTVTYEELPADIRDALNAEETMAFREGGDYFVARVERCSYPLMKKFFRLLAERGAGRLHLYGKSQPVYRAYFGFNLPAASRYVQLRLGPARLPGQPPAALVAIYQDINGTIDGDENVGGWVAVEEIKRVTEHRWQPSHMGGYDPDQCYPVYSFGNGDYIGYQGKKGFLYDHEDGGRLEPYDLLKHARDYFGGYVRMFRT